MVANAAHLPALLPPNAVVPAVDPKTGQWSSAGLNILNQIIAAVNGASPTVPCTCISASNVYTLTPFPISPMLKGYYDYWCFAFVADATSTDTVTATIVPDTGTLSTLPVFKSNGATAAGAGDITINRFYRLYYVDTLNSGQGAFVLA